ncbi:outer membrane beta-barrel protein [Aquabacterium sp. CECT 9606]|uniref:outer membrane beta-barrel protein n=1 Tax=Aquabacterium sp. CECT 9606 TaxID=2845822 RepID=UPI001E43688D|nr:outer membrane beta-barrel protein [Aquabacterium sp. CECT 9606]CAH0356202.1 hypothetical protein AQB9606_04612 [Aquabacterium sp. CECT 9606]
MKKIISAALLTLAVGGASAQAYVGGAIGVTNANIACAGTTKCDKTDTGFKLYGGYTVTEGFAVEAGYLDLGQNTASVGVVNLDFKTQAVFLAGAARGEFTPELGGTLRLGVAGVKTSGRAGAASIGTVVSDSDTKYKAYVGLALDYAFTKNVKGVVAADFTTAEVADEAMAVRMFSIGAQYSF